MAAKNVRNRPARAAPASRTELYCKTCQSVRWTVGRTVLTKSVPDVVIVVEGNHGGAKFPCAKR
jgi:hypothetical protein